MKRLVYRFINWYAVRFQFPPKGLSVLYNACKMLGIHQLNYLKKLPSGLMFELQLQDHIQKQLFWHGRYEFDELQLLLQFIHPGDTFIDAGANIGYYSLHAALRTGVDGKVFAFEPSASTFIHLQKNIALNNTNVISAVKKALSNHAATAALFISGNENTGTTGLQPGEEFSGKTEMIEVVALDEFLKDDLIKNISAVKIDVEGHELQAIKGMIKTLQTFKPAVLAEVITVQLNRHKTKPEELYLLMQTLGYKAFYLGDSKKLAPVPDFKFEGYGIFFLRPAHLSQSFLKAKLQ